MNKKQLKLLILITSAIAPQCMFAHGVGGGSSYEFDQKDQFSEREADKKALEKKKDQDTWADFMEAVNKSDKDKESEHSQDHHAGE